MKKLKEVNKKEVSKFKTGDRIKVTKVIGDPKPGIHQYFYPVGLQGTVKGTEAVLGKFEGKPASIWVVKATLDKGATTFQSDKPGLSFGLSVSSSDNTAVLNLLPSFITKI